MPAKVIQRMADFFISYTQPDEEWAEWIGWVLEEQGGFEVILQKWDFPAGSNFVLEMQKATATAKRTIAVLSPDYLATSRFGSAEWAAAFVHDPDGTTRTLVPVKVRACAPTGLLKPIVYIDLTPLNDDAAAEKLLEELKGERRKPKTRPSFPGAKGKTISKPSATAAASSAAARAPYIPKLRGSSSDLDKRRFIKDTFEIICQRFDEWLAELKASDGRIDFDVTRIDATTVTAEIFIHGDSRGACKIWIGGMFGGNDIAYAEGRHSMLGSNSMNESLSIADGDGLALNAMMNMGFGKADDGLDMHHLSSEDAALYLWRRFCSTFER